MKISRRALALITATLASGAIAAVSPATHAAASTGSLNHLWSYTVGNTSGSTHASSVSGEPFGGATVADLFGNGSKDVVAGFQDGSVWAWDASGHVLPGWPVYVGAPIHANPAVADLDNDGRQEVVVTSENGFVNVYGANGQEPQGWPQRTIAAASNVPPGNFGGAAIGDLFGDGRKEIVVASWDMHLTAWFANGSLVPGFPFRLYDDSWETPMLADLEHKGQLDIVVGNDSSGPPWNPFPAGGTMFAFRPSGCVSDGTRVMPAQQPCLLPGWPKTFDQVPWSSPVGADLQGNGTTDVVEGTGVYFNDPAGHYDSAWTSTGGPFGSWPAATNGRNLGTPAIGDLTGNGLDVVQDSDSGWLYAWNADGQLLPGWPRYEYQPLRAMPTIGPIDSTHNGVWIIVGGSIEGIDSGGNVRWSTPLHIVGDAAPTLVNLGNGTLDVITITQADAQATNWQIDAWSVPGTNGSLLPGSWPTFHGNAQNTGTFEPSATMNSLPSSESTTGFTLSWALDAGSVAARSYTLWVKDMTVGSWQMYGRTSNTSMPFYGVPGRQYEFQIQADSSEPDLGGTLASTTVASNASRSTPFKGLYAVDGYGTLRPASSAPLPNPGNWPGWDIVRGLALRSNGVSGYALDGFGGVHPFGGAPQVQVSGYWSGWDIARGIVLRPDGQSGYVLDGWGGLHPFGVSGDMPPSISNGPYWRGWDIARSVVLRADGASGYILDGWGGVNAFGGAPPVLASAYWNGWDIARGLALAPDGHSGYVVDGWGGLHTFGDAPAATDSAYWRGWDIARGVTLLPGTTEGYVVDGLGGFHPFGGAPSVAVPNWGGPAPVHGAGSA